MDADVDQASIPPSILASGGKHGGYGTWQLMMSVFRMYKTCTGGVYLLVKALPSQGPAILYICLLDLSSWLNVSRYQSPDNDLQMQVC